MKPLFVFSMLIPAGLSAATLSTTAQTGLLASCAGDGHVSGSYSAHSYMPLCDPDDHEYAWGESLARAEAGYGTLGASGWAFGEAPHATAFAAFADSLIFYGGSGTVEVTYDIGGRGFVQVSEFSLDYPGGYLRGSLEDWDSSGYAEGEVSQSHTFTIPFSEGSPFALSAGVGVWINAVQGYGEAEVSARLSSIRLHGPNGDPLSVRYKSESGARYPVESAAYIPEPSTCVLLLTGGMVLPIRRRVRSGLFPR